MFRRFRRRFIAALELSAGLYLLLGLALPAALSVAFYYRMSASETAIVGGVVSVVLFVASRVGNFTLRRELVDLKRWLRGEPVAAEMVLPLLLVVVTKVIQRTLVTQTVGHTILTVAVIARYGEFSVADWLGTELALAGVLLAGAIIVLQAWQILVRPAAQELAEQLPAGTVLPRAGLSVATRLTVGVLAAGMTTGAVSVALSSRVDSQGGRWLIALLVAAAFASYTTWMLRVGLIDAALEPLDDVIGATRRVGAGDFTTPVIVTSADELAALATAFNDMQRGLGEREALQNAFGSYVDPALATRLLAQGDSVFAGEEVEVSVFFADIRGFTSFAERVSVHDAVGTLNRFFSIVVRVISEHGGHTNSYLGDGVLGVFGAPVPLTDHADRAVAAALMVLKQIRDEFGDDMRIGIGVNSGNVIAGTVGGEGKLEFTVIGGPVNIAARVEQLTKETGDGVLITAATRDALTRVPEGLVDRGEFEVRGTERRVRLFSVG